VVTGTDFVFGIVKDCYVFRTFLAKLKANGTEITIFCLD